VLVFTTVPPASVTVTVWFAWVTVRSHGPLAGQFCAA